MPRKTGATPVSATSPGCFNEAGAVMPRKEEDGWRGHAGYPGFNEAGAVMPRKPAADDSAALPGPGFNEAGAVMPRKVCSRSVFRWRFRALQ